MQDALATHEHVYVRVAKHRVQPVSKRKLKYPRPYARSRFYMS